MRETEAEALLKGSSYHNPSPVSVSPRSWVYTRSLACFRRSLDMNLEPENVGQHC